MAKEKSDATAPESVEAVESVESVAPVQTRLMTGWRLRPRVGGDWFEVQADTLEDAVRAFNSAGGRGGRTLAAKQLEIEAPPSVQVL
jgi:hypothetical protein